MATAMAMGNCDGNGNSNSDGVGNGGRDGDGDGNGNGHGKGNHYKGRVPLHVVVMCSAFGGATPCPHPHGHTQKCMRHGGDTAKSVCSPSRGRVPDSSPWIVFCLFFTITVQFTEQPSVCPPRIIQALQNSPVSQLMLYLLHSSKNPVSLSTIYPGSYCTFLSR